MNPRLIVLLIALTSISFGFAHGSGAPQEQKTVAFEVASIRSNKSGGAAMNMGRPFRGNRYAATNAAVRNLIALAYEIPTARVVGGPPWVGEVSTDLRFVGGDRFDITAALPEGGKTNQIPAMLRALLADRFQLIVHTETREAPMYALVVARNDGRLGPELRKASIDCEAVQAAGTPAAADSNLCQSEVGGAIFGRGQRISALALSLSLFTDRPVVDRSGLNGGFDFELRFPELNTAPNAAGPRSDPSSGVFTALQEQLGLKLESIRGNLEFIVIDKVEHPTEN
jgi:uncharacterized protein (TIGR03435 family)